MSILNIAKESASSGNAAVRAILDASKLPYLETADSPVATKLTLAEAMGDIIGTRRPSQWDVACRAAGASLEHPLVPIVAVLGELNAGKSSVVAAFLSSEGRRRLPRGEGEASGTHRFVYWVPQQWLADEVRKSALLDLLAAAHGPSHEELSHDPATSAAQYRSGREHPERIGVPLVAGDAALDEFGAAFLDCPDVQTRDFTAVNRTTEDNARMQFVVQAARLCATFCVIWRRSQIRDQLFRDLLGTIRETMRKTRLCLLLNMIKPVAGQPGKTRRDPDVEQALSDFGIDGSDVYGAFDYDHEGWRSMTASALVQRFDDAAADDPTFRFPQFFQLSSDDSSNGPAVVGDDRFLVNLPSRLDPTELQERLLRERVVELRRKGHEACREVDAALDRRRRATREAYEGLFERCRAQFTDDKGGPKQIASPEFNKELEKSFYRTAPVMAKIPLWARDFAHSARVKGAEFVSRMIPSAETRRRLTNWIAQRNETQAGGFDFVDPEKLAEQMLASPWVPPEIQKSTILAAWQAVLGRLTLWSPPVDRNALDAMTGKLWQEIADQQSRRRVWGAILSLFAVFGIIVAVIDGGATAMVSYSLANAVAAKLYGAAAIGGSFVAVGVSAFTAMQLDAMKLNTLPYLCAMRLLACDAFGLPREVAGPPLVVRFNAAGCEETYSLPDVEVPPLEAICPLGDHRVWRHALTADAYRKVLADA